MDRIEEEIKFLCSIPLEARQKCIVKLQKTLNEIDLDNMLVTKRLTILCKIIDIARKCDAAKEIIDAIVKRWDPSQTEKIDPDGILGDLAATFICSSENLKYLVTLYPYSTPMTILDAHIRSRLDSGMIFKVVADRILDTYDVNNLEEFEWEQLVTAAENTQTLKTKQHTIEILSYIHDKLGKKNRKIKAKKPEWVKPAGPPDDLNKNKEEINDFLKKVNIKENVDSLVEKTLDNSSKNLTRTLGPINPIDGFDCVSYDGPCRMFSCMCREEDEDDLTSSEVLQSGVFHSGKQSSLTSSETLQVSWFSGECEICNKSIEHYRYAVRLPVVGGGFVGCFCSFECMYKTDLPLGEDNDHLIDELQDILNNVGIEDIF